MILAFDFSDLPGDAIGLLLLMIISFLGWLKNRFGQREIEEEPVSEEEERMREIVWRRQMGEQEDRAPWETDPTVWHPEKVAPPPLPEPPPLPATPAAVKASVPKLSAREERLAEAFERKTKGRRRTAGRRAPIGDSLRSPDATRRAVILAEVLGPPVSLRQTGERHP